MGVEPLQIEFHYYIAHQDELVAKYEGKWIVLKNHEILGVEVLGAYDSIWAAIDETERCHELGTFMVHECGPGVENYTIALHVGSGPKIDTENNIAPAVIGIYSKEAPLDDTL